MRTLKLSEKEAQHMAIFLRSHATVKGWYCDHCLLTFEEPVIQTVLMVEARLGIAPKRDRRGQPSTEAGHD